MAHAKICDRCEGIYSKNRYAVNFGGKKAGLVKGVVLMLNKPEDATDDGEPKNMFMDLCDTCSEKLVNFLRNEIDIFLPDGE